MQQYTGISRYSHRGLPAWQTALLLCCFLAVRGLVPAGYMPAPLSAGTPYGLCHGDSRAALLLNSLQTSQVHDGHHSGHYGNHHNAHSAGHDHDPATAKYFADSTCAFAAAATSNVGGELADLGALRSRSSRSTAAQWHFDSQPAYFIPPGRAPPAIS